VAKRVVICSARSLFGHGIKALLDAEPELEVVGWESEIEAVINRIREFQPEAVLVVYDGSPNSAALSGKQFLSAGIKVKIIELNFDDNIMCVYSGEQIDVTDVNDVIKAIQAPVTSLTAH
jgi:DNA-binding NarL/FixJ family response regulator